MAEPWEKLEAEMRQMPLPDLSPELQKDIDKWLDRADDPEAFKKISEMVGPEQARLLIARRRKRRAESGADDDLLDQ